jgi:NitT/TauT family transport system ATP-binding protein
MKDVFVAENAITKPRGVTAKATAPLGQLQNIAKVFPLGKDETITAVEDVSFTFGRGELVSLLGPSGCGKTTVLKMIGGLIPASSGTILVDGVKVNGPFPNVGMVFQTPTLMVWRNVKDNVLFPMEVLHKNDAAAAHKAQELLEMVGLGGFEKSYPRQLSGGMQQRVALCRALIHEPSILLMDEPFGALDELTRLEMNDLLLEIRKVTGATVIFVTHSISEAIYLADRVLVFSKRPAVIALEIQVDLSYPRATETRFQKKFNELEKQAGVALGVVK